MSETVSLQQAIRLDASITNRLNYAFQQNDVPVLRELVVTNVGVDDIHDLSIRAAVESGIAKPWEAKLQRLAPGESRRFNQIDLRLDAAKLANLLEREKTQLQLAAVSGDVTLLEQEHPLEVLAFNQWAGLRVLPEIISAFVCPNHPAIASALDAVHDSMKQLTGSPSLDGYQSASRDRARKMVASVYNAMKACRIRYINPPASFDEGQKIRTPDEVLREPRNGTCLDLAVVAAAFIEQIGLHPILVFMKGHAFVGAWLQDTQFSDPLIDDAGRIANRVALDEMVVFETTTLVEGVDVPFESSVRAAVQNLERDGEFVTGVDICAARKFNILPLPPRIQSGSGYVVVETHPRTDPSIVGVDSVRNIGEDPAPRTPRDAGPKLADGLSAEVMNRLERWKRKLLDLSLRNPLLSFKEDSKRGVPLLVSDVAELENRLVNGDAFMLGPKTSLADESSGRNLDLETQRSGRDIPKEILQQEFRRGFLRIDAGSAFEGRLTELFRTARTAVEETGSGTLYLTLGALRWFETRESQTPRYAPLLLMPARIERPQPGQFRLLAGDGDATVNVTLIEKLKHDFQIDAANLLELQQDESGIDVQALFRAFREVIKDVPRWDVRETAFLGHFSFAKFMLYEDLSNRLTEVARSPTVNFILTRKGEGDAFSDFPPESAIDRLPAESSLCPLDADSSQQVAVEAAMTGKTFVLQGPPGTGKSQTITNLIARAIASGKRVLFVAEKLAALSVVRSRLQRVGVGPFVLELHSNKANKKDVLEQIRVALEAPTPKAATDWEDQIAELTLLKRQLNEYVEALHTPRPSGETAYQVISRINTLPDALPIPCSFDNALNTTSTQLKSMRSSIENAVRAAQSLGGVGDHPLQGIRVTDWRLDLAEKIRELISSSQQALGVIRHSIQKWLAALGYTEIEIDRLRVGNLQPLYLFTKLLLQRDSIILDHFQQASPQQHFQSVGECIAKGRQAGKQLTELAEKYLPAFLDADHAALSQQVTTVQRSGFISRLFKMPGLTRTLCAFTRDGGKPDLSVFVADCATAAQTRTLQNELAASVVGGQRSDWDGLEAETNWASEVSRHVSGASTMSAEDTRLRTALSSLYANSGMKPGQPAREAAETFLDAVRSLQRVLSDLEKCAGASQAEITGRNLAPLVSTLETTLNRWMGGLSSLAEWVAWQSVIRADGAKALSPFFDAMIRAELLPNQVKSAFEASYARSWLTALFSSERSLQRFTYDSRTRLIEDFRTTDRRVMELSRNVLARTVASQRPAANMSAANPASELGILKRQLQLQRNHKSVRRLVKELPTILPKLKPVWLMSPLSVAQFLDPATPPFDLVVFDEASQIPVWDAIGALARGQRAVVVGDSKQLPPTNFFQRQESGTDEEDVELEELESILDECVAATIPELRLRWHYRSKHESLIAFSNQQYYDNHLHTFPSADDSTDRLGVSLRYLPDATYDRGGSRQNLGEARAIVDDVFKRLAETGNGSIGVVTFSVAQQQLIEDLLDAELRKRPEFKRFFDSKEPEYVFVKNLENVQGDERDVILFSICYGRTATGTMSISFGPINGRGGERRLNVAITRARVQVVVFTSIKAEHIDLSRSRARGVADLRSFLDFAERGPKALFEIVSPNGEDQFDSPFEQEVCRALRERGWSVDTQVGCSGYRIDMAVRDPQKPGRYLLGVECDGASYHSAASARDRDRLREEVLRGLGWTLHRIWSTDWMQHRDKALARLVAALESAKALSESTPEPMPVATDISPDTEARGDLLRAAQPIPKGPQADLKQPSGIQGPQHLPGGRYYQFAELPSRDTDSFYTAASDRALGEDIRAVVSVEAPVHAEELAERIARVWGLQRVTRRVETRIGELLTQHAVEVSADGFIRGGHPSSEGFRILPSGEQRELRYVAPEEIKAAVQAVLASQGGLPEESLITEIARLFGYSRVREATREVIRGAMK